jgi:hypothetical protein
MNVIMNPVMGSITPAEEARKKRLQQESKKELQEFLAHQANEKHPRLRRLLKHSEINSNIILHDDSTTHRYENQRIQEPEFKKELNYTSQDLNFAQAPTQPIQKPAPVYPPNQMPNHPIYQASYPTNIASSNYQRPMISTSLI